MVKYLISISFFLFSGSAFATCWHCSNGETEIIEQTVVEQTIIEQSISNEIDRSTAIGIASNHQFNLAIPDLQWSVNAAGYRNSSAVSFSLGKKLNNLFIHGAITNEDELGEQSYSVGVSGKF